MKENLKKFVNSRNSLANGFLAIMVIVLIALGCTCKDKFNNLGGDNTNSSNSTIDKEDGDLSETPEKKEIVKADASKGEIPSDEELQEIVKTNLLNFNDAIQQKDFTNFHKTISEAWQKQVQPITFEDGFKSFIDKGVDISEIRSQKATFSPPPNLDKEQGLERLYVNGSYPTSPKPTTFKLQYIAEGKEWKLFAIEVYTSSFKK